MSAPPRKIVRKGSSIVRLVMTIPVKESPAANFLCWGRARNHPDSATRQAMREDLQPSYYLKGAVSLAARSTEYLPLVF